MLADSDKLTISHKLALLVVVPLVLEIAILLSLGVLLYQEQQESQREARQEEIIDACDHVSHLATYAVGQLAMHTVTRSDRYLQSYKAIKQTHDEQFAKLQELCRDNPTLEAKVAILKRNSEHIYTLFEDANQKVVHRTDSFGNEHSTFKSMPEFLSDRKALPIVLAKQIKDSDDFRLAVEKDLEAKISKETWKTWIKSILALGVIGNVLLSVALARMVGTQINSRLHRLVDNSIRLASGQPLSPRLRGNDEIATVDEMFHVMADRIEVAAKTEKSIVDNAADMIGSLDRKGRVTAVNPASTNRLGYEPQDLLGRYLADLAADGDKEHLREALLSIANPTMQATNQAQTSVESAVKCNDGRLAQILWSLFWSAPQQAYFFIAHDTTERKRDEDRLKESESRLRLIMESIPIGLLIVNPQGIVETANMRSLQMFGHENAEIVNKSLEHFLDKKSFDEQQHFDLSAIAENKSAEIEARKNTGETFQIELSLTDFYLRGERKILATIADITERKEAERLKKEFVAMVSDDLRTPLIHIQQALTALLSGEFGPLDQRSQSFVGKSDKETERLLQLINSLLDIEKLETGQMGMQREPVDVDSIASAAVASVSYLAEKNGIHIQSMIAPCKVLADRSRLVQVLVNLLANAIKFSPKGSTITISGIQETASIKLSVIDQGRGIPESHLQTIFERFKQVKAADHAEKGGSGLGLAICKVIVEAHGGKIGVESVVDKGSTFWLTIPNQGAVSTT